MAFSIANLLTVVVMLNSIIEFSVKNKLIIALFTIGLILFGVYELRRLPIDAQPDITNNQVQIITVAPSYGAVDIERLVTFPIEQATSNIKGLMEMRSFSRFGLSLVTVVFDESTDVYWARQQVSERLQMVKEEIPDEIGIPELGPISTGLGEIFQYIVRAKEGYEKQYDETELRTIQDWVIRRQLLGTPGVAEVSSFGGKLKQYQISIDPNKLLSFKINIQDIFQALEENNQNTGGAYIERHETVLFIRSEGLLGGIDDIERIPIKISNERTPILLRDVATVQIGHAIRYGAMTYNDQGEVSGAIVMMLKGENANDVIKNIKERLKVIEEDLPEGVIIEPFLDRAKMVNNTIHTVKTNLMEGALIVVFILVLFLGNFRAGFLVASVIPLSMLFAVIMMNIFGVGGNLMSLGALDFGLIVDGAVIIVEAVLHQLAHRNIGGSSMALSQQDMDKGVTGSASKMANSAVFGQMIILIVYLPIFSLQGIEGKMFVPMAQTVTFALIGAFILSLTYIPMMSSLVLSKKVSQKRTWSDRMMYRLERLHRKMLVRALRLKVLILAVVAVLFVFAVVLLSRMGGEFIPSLEEGDFAVEMRILQGSNISKTIDVTTKAARILKEEFPEVEKIVTKIGSAEIPTEPMPMDAGDMIIVLKPKKEWTSAKTFSELSEKMSDALDVIPGLTTGFQFPVQMRFNELMTGARQDVVCKIYGEDLDSLAAYAQRLGGIIQSVKGAEDLYIEPVVGAPQVIIDFDRSALARHNISVSDANRVINAAFAGQQAGMLYEGERRFDLVVRLADEKRQSMEHIRNLLIPTPAGIQIPLYQLAAVDLKSNPNQIQREDTKRRIVVGFNIRGRDVQSIVEELEQKVSEQMPLSKGYSMNYGGAFENLNHAKERLGIAVPIALSLIFLLLFFAFKSVKQSLLIYTAIPLSAIGGIYFLVLRGMPFSISAGVGFIALFGVAVLNGIVLIAEFNRLRKQGIASVAQVVLRGSKVRLRPVLMTACVASLGFLPMAISTGSGAEVQRPLATVVIGGLLLATFLTLFVLPILYLLSEKHNKQKMNTKIIQVVVFAFFFFSGNMLVAQHRVTLEEALEIAKQHNLEIKSRQAYSAYKAKLTETSWNIPQTEAYGEYGKLEGFDNDNRIGLNQQINFPTVYAKRKRVLKEEWQTAQLEEGLTALQTTREVRHVFYQIQILYDRKTILQHMDSIYAEFVDKNKLRLQVGDANALEATVAETQREQIAVQRRLLDSELKKAVLEFQWLLQGDQDYIPLDGDSKAVYLYTGRVDAVEAHPELQVLEQAIRISEAETAWTASQLLPDLSVGFSSQSFKSINNDRFNSVRVGVGIPIFTQGQRKAIRAAKVKEHVEKQQLDSRASELHKVYRQLMAELEQQSLVLANYEKKQLPQAEKILETAKQQFSAGDINYLEWVMLTNQAIDMRVKYLDVVSEQNRTITELFYLIEQ